jgi:hypothetical protein
MSEIAGILNAIGRNLEGVDKRRQEQNKVRNQLVREGFDVAPERVGQGTGNKILAGLFGGTSDPTTRATMSERHPYMQAIAKAQADKDQRAITNQLARDQYNATKSYNDEMLKIQQDNNDIRRQQLGLDLVKEWRGMVVAKTAERQGILDSINARASDLAKQDTPEALQKMMELVAQVETEITEVYNGSLYDWFTPDNWGRDEFQAAEFVGNNYSTDTAKHLRRLTAQRKTLLEALAKWDQNILAKSSRELGPMWSALFETMKNNDDFLFSGKIPAPKFGPDGKVEFDLNPMHFGGTRTGLTGDSGGFYSDLNKVANNQELEGDSLDNEASEDSEEAELAEYHRSQAFRNTSLSGAMRNESIYDPEAERKRRLEEYGERARGTQEGLESFLRRDFIEGDRYSNPIDNSGKSINPLRWEYPSANPLKWEQLDNSRVFPKTTKTGQDIRSSYGSLYRQED